MLDRLIFFHHHTDANIIGKLTEITHRNGSLFPLRNATTTSLRVLCLVGYLAELVLDFKVSIIALMIAPARAGTQSCRAGPLLPASGRS